MTRRREIFGQTIFLTNNRRRTLESGTSDNGAPRRLLFYAKM